jgi:hypothetical protein
VAAAAAEEISAEEEFKEENQISFFRQLSERVWGGGCYKYNTCTRWS